MTLQKQKCESCEKQLIEFHRKICRYPTDGLEPSAGVVEKQEVLDTKEKIKHRFDVLTKQTEKDYWETEVSVDCVSL